MILKHRIAHLNDTRAHVCTRIWAEVKKVFFLIYEV
jgi:hypothetical protein